MSPRQLLRKHFSLSTPLLPFRPRIRNTRQLSASQKNTESRTRARITSLHARLPKFLHPYTRGLLRAPVSHLVAFFILHEITAVVPLVGLAALFHYTDWLPQSWVEGRWVREGVERFGRYFGSKGWFGFSRETGKVGIEDGGLEESGMINGDAVTIEGTERRWRVGENGSRILVEVATAYAITKVFLPVRILLSVWGTPWFARVFVGRFTGLFGKRVASGSAPVGLSAGGATRKGIEGTKKIPP